MKVYASLDNVSFSQKPSKEDVPKIKYRASGNWVEVEVAKAADLVGNKGHTMVPAHLVGGIKTENCVAMQLFTLDFDDGITFREVKGRCDSLGIPIAFAYHTFSSSGEKEKFRVVFAYWHLVEDLFVIKLILLMLHGIFPECDKSCSNPDRMFFGGKGLIHVDDDACIAWGQILYPFYNSLDIGGNSKRNILSFCRKNRIFTLGDGTPAIAPVDSMGQYAGADGFPDTATPHRIEEPTGPSFFVVEDSGGGLHHQNACTRKEGGGRCQNSMCREKMRKLEIGMGSACRLLDDFISGGEKLLGHNARFAVFTNLQHINGGNKLFFDVLGKHYGNATYEKWKKDARYMKNYHSQRCSPDFCPYYAGCENAGTIADTLAMDRRVCREEGQYYPIEEASRHLKENLEEALCSRRRGIHLIKAQTGLGKTRTYIDLIKEHPEMKFLVALPTNSLKEQVMGDLSVKLQVEELFMTLSPRGNIFFPLDIQAEISEAHKHGIHNKTKKIISEYYKGIKDDPNKIGVAKECERILDGIKAIEGQRVVVTTHAFFMNLSEEFLKNYTIIIDEDILQLQILNRTASVRQACLEKLLEQGCPGYSGIAGEMLQAMENEYRKIQGIPYIEPLTEEQLSELGVSEDDNANDIVHAGSFVRMKDRNSGDMTVKYFYPQKLYPMKYIVLSATLNERIYREYFKGSMEVCMYPEKKAAYKGKLVQYTYHSLGRKDLSGKMQVFDFIRTLANNPKLEIITFKENPYLKGLSGMNTKGLHFGNTCGINSLSGQDIGIVGTYYQQEEAYKLVACYLGADVNCDVDRRPKPRRVKYNGCSFLITTYDAPLLREVQLCSIESEMEQCVGRARLLRGDCTVYLLSAFPCEQAELRIKDYLIQSELTQDM